MKGFVSLIALVASFSSVSSAVQTTSAILKPAVCRVALGGIQAEERDALINEAVNLGILLGPMHMEAFIRAAEENGLLETTSEGMKDDLYDPQQKLRLLAPHLKVSNSPGDIEFQLELAANMVTSLEKVLAHIPGSNSLDLKVNLEARHKSLKVRGKFRPSAEQLGSKIAAFKGFLSRPGARELLLQAYVLSNADIAVAVRRGWTRDSFGLWYGKGLLNLGGLTAGVHAVFGTSAVLAGLPDALPVALIGGAGATAAGARAYINSQKVTTDLWMKITLARRKKRLEDLIAKSFADNPELIRQIDGMFPPRSGSGVMKEASKLLPASVEQKAVVAAIEKGRTAQVASSILELRPSLGSSTFEEIASFGAGINSEIASAGDMLLLITRHVELFGREIDKLSALSDSLARSEASMAALIETAFASSTQIVSETIAFQELLSALSLKADEFSKFGRAAKPGLKLDFQSEIEDAVIELETTAAYLVPIMKMVPQAIETTKLQRATLRELRAALRGKKLQDEGSMKALRAAVEKLKATRADLLQQLGAAAEL